MSHISKSTGIENNVVKVPDTDSDSYQYIDFTTVAGKATLWDKPANGRYKIPTDVLQNWVLTNFN